jgi:hypothetical protein
MLEVTFVAFTALTSSGTIHKPKGYENKISQKTKCSDAAKGKLYHHDGDNSHIALGNDHRLRTLSGSEASNFFCKTWLVAGPIEKSSLVCGYCDEPYYLSQARINETSRGLEKTNPARGHALQSSFYPEREFHGLLQEAPTGAESVGYALFLETGCSYRSAYSSPLLELKQHFVFH